MGRIQDTIVHSSSSQVLDPDDTWHRIALYLGLLNLLLVDVHSHASVQFIQPELKCCIVIWLYPAAIVSAFVVGCEEFVPNVLYHKILFEMKGRAGEGR